MLVRCLQLLVKHRNFTLFLALVVFAGAASFLPRLSVNDSPERWLPHSTVESWKEYAKHYDFGDTIVIGLQFHRAVVDEDIERIRSLHAQCADVPGVVSVKDASLLTDLVERVPLTTLLAAPVKGEVDNYKVYRGALFDDPAIWKQPGDTDPGRTLLVVVELEDDTDQTKSPAEQKEELDTRRRFVSLAVEKIVRAHEEDGVVTAHVASPIVIQMDLERTAERIVTRLVPAAMLLALLALGVGFRSWAAVVIAIGGGVWASAVMLGGVAAAGWTMSVLTVTGPILMAVIVIATTVHFAHYHSVPDHSHDVSPMEHEHDAAALAGEKAATDRLHFLRWVGVPCLGAALTTGFGFLMLTFNELQPARELGIELFYGSVLAFIGALLMWLAIPRFRAARGRWLSAENLEGLYRGVVRSPRGTSAMLCLMLICIGVAASRVVPNADPFSFFKPETDIAKALDHFSERRFGHYLLDVALVPRAELPSDPEGRARAVAENAKQVREFERRVSKEDEVRNVISTDGMRGKIAEFEQKRKETLEEMNWRPPGFRWLGGKNPAGAPLDKLAWFPPAVHWMTGSKVKAAAWLAEGNLGKAAGYTARVFVFRRIFRNWLRDKADVDTHRVTFMVYESGRGFGALMDAARAAAPTEDFDVHYTGTAASVAMLSEQLIGGMTKSLLVAMAAMGLVCIILFRSVKMTAIAFLPNSFPVMVVFGVMGLCGIPLNCGSAMVTTIALGVGLNDTVHFVMHYRGRREEGADVHSALEGTFGEIGRPIVLTSVVNCAGFGIIFLSDFLPMSHFGLLAAVAMIAALVGDLVLLPNLLLLFDGDAVESSVEAAPVEATV